MRKTLALVFVVGVIPLYAMSDEERWICTVTKSDGSQPRVVTLTVRSNEIVVTSGVSGYSQYRDFSSHDDWLVFGQRGGFGVDHSRLNKITGRYINLGLNLDSDDPNAARLEIHGVGDCVLK